MNKNTQMTLVFSGAILNMVIGIIWICLCHGSSQKPLNLIELAWAIPTGIFNACAVYWLYNGGSWKPKS